jgi:C4-dicarboxylate-specific signal transduction histidine kinase
MSKERSSESSNTAILETLGTVGAKLGHDFNNLFAAIQGCAELMKIKLGKLPEGNPCARQIQIIESSIQKGILMTNQMRGWVRNEAIPLKNMPLEPLVKSVVEFLNSSKVASTEIEMAVLEQPSAPTSEFHVRQALMALCANALDAMQSQQDRVLVLILDGGSDFARISVVDHGIGIAEEKRESLLQPTISTKNHKVGEGLGVNLAMVNELMKRLGGELVIRSAVGVGSAFSLVFPRST